MTDMEINLDLLRIFSVMGLVIVVTAIGGLVTIKAIEKVLGTKNVLKAEAVILSILAIGALFGGSKRKR